MKKALLILIVFISSWAIAGANDNGKKVFCGKVRDSITGEAIAGAKVEMKETGNACYSDLNGNFVLTVAIDNKEELEVNIVGYELTKVKSADMGFNKDISLNPIQ